MKLDKLVLRSIEVSGYTTIEHLTYVIKSNWDKLGYYSYSEIRDKIDEIIDKYCLKKIFSEDIGFYIITF